MDLEEFRKYSKERTFPRLVSLSRLPADFRAYLQMIILRQEASSELGVGDFRILLFLVGLPCSRPGCRQ